MPNLFVLLNHTLTEEQINQVISQYDIKEIILPPVNVQELWGQVPPDIESLVNYLKPVFEWLNKQAISDDFLIVEGDFGATYLMVRYAFGHNIIPLYATTSRDAYEERNDDGSISIKRNFRHVLFPLNFFFKHLLSVVIISNLPLIIKI